MLLVVGMTVVVILAFVIPLAILIRNTVYTNAVHDVQAEAATISSQLRAGDSQPTNAQISAYLKSLGGDRSASVEVNGTVLGTPPPGRPPTPTPANGPEFGPAPGGGGDPGGAPMTWQGGKLAQLQTGPYLVRVYASDEQLHSGQSGWWLLLGLCGLALLLLGVAAAEVLTRRLVRPLLETATTANRLGSGDITARAPTRGPHEIAEVGVALNRLADRIDELIADERETVADLSHRLRTPLTALRLDAEALHDPAEADRIGNHASALERMLTAVIHAARRPQREGRLPSCDATAVVGDRVEFWSALAEDQARSSTVELPQIPLPVRASAEDLAAAVDALLENVIAHTREGTAFAVRLGPAEGGARLEIADDGPGLPAGEPVRGRSDRGSSGLGLDIARRCAEAAGGAMALGASPSGGALITLTFKAP